MGPYRARMMKVVLLVVFAGLAAAQFQNPMMGMPPQMMGMPQMPQMPQMPGMPGMPQMGQMPPMMMPPMPMGAPSAAQHPAFQNLMQTESKTQSKFVGAPLLNLFLAYLFFKWHYPFYPVQQNAAQAMPQAPVRSLLWQILSRARVPSKWTNRQ